MIIGPNFTLKIIGPELPGNTYGSSLFRSPARGVVLLLGYNIYNYLHADFGVKTYPFDLVVIFGRLLLADQHTLILNIKLNL